MLFELAFSIFNTIKEYELKPPELLVYEGLDLKTFGLQVVYHFATENGKDEQVTTSVKVPKPPWFESFA